MASIMDRCPCAGSSIAADRAEEAAEAARQTAERVAEAVDLAAEAHQIARRAEETADEAKRIALGAEAKVNGLDEKIETHVKDKGAHGASMAATAGAIARRDSQGAISAADPTSGSHLVTLRHLEQALKDLSDGAGEDGSRHIDGGGPDAVYS